MTVILFQIFVIATIAGARAASKSALLPVCVLWSAFTLLAVFASPLILLQLATIWITYLALKGTTKGDGAAVAPAHRIRPQDTRSPTVPSSAAPKHIPVTSRQALAHTSAQAVEQATSQLELDVYAERLAIDSALDAARRKVEIERHFAGDPVAAEHYREAYLRISAQIDATGPELESAETIALRRPDFSRQPAHSQPEIAVRIEHALEQLEEQRTTFIQTVKAQLASDDDLRNAFVNVLQEWVGPDIVGALLQDLELNGSADTRRQTVIVEVRKPARLNLADVLGRTSSGPSDPVAAEAGNMLRQLCIVQEVRRRSIPYLVHFTQAENLPSIMTLGLLSIAELKQRGTRFFSNDALRLDHQPHATSLSIAFPNDKLFFKARRPNPAKAWAVLIIDPAILWKSDVAFCAHNAASTRVSMQAIDKRKEAPALSAMFSPNRNGPSREEQFLASYDPTDVQAEILAFEAIPPAAITGLAFSSSAQLARYRHVLGDRRATVHREGDGFFGPRSQARRAGWQF